MSDVEPRVSASRGALGFALVLGAAVVVLAVAYGTARLSDTSYCNTVVPGWEGGVEIRNFQLFCENSIGTYVLAFDGRGPAYVALGVAGLLLVLAFLSLNPRVQFGGKG